MEEAVRFVTLEEYRRNIGIEEEIELERGARPAYWPAEA